MSYLQAKADTLITRLALLITGLTLVSATVGLMEILNNSWLGQDVPRLIVFSMSDLAARFYDHYLPLAVIISVWTFLQPARTATRRSRFIDALSVVALVGLAFWMDVLPQIVGWLRGMGLKTWLLGLPTPLLWAMGLALLVAALLAVRVWSASRHFAWCGDLWSNRRGVRETRIVGGVLLAISIVLLLAPRLLEGRAGGPNVILISIDTLRADHLSGYGYAKSTSPVLDDFARRGLQFDNALSQAPWTLPSMATLHTGLYPHQHGAVLNSHRIHRNALTLAEVFRNAAYRTVGIISHTFVNASFGFDQGFEVFDTTNVGDHATITSGGLTETAMSYLQDAGDRPFFMWIHYFDPHANYIHHDEFPFADPSYDGPLEKRIVFQQLSVRVDQLTPADYDYTRAAYDSEIAFTDFHIGRLLNALADLQIDDRTIVAIVADHGEAFGDHDHLGHGQMVYQELVHVPLLILDPTHPETGARKVATPVEARFLARTLLSAAGLKGRRLPGADLYGLARGDTPPPVFSEGTYAWGTDKRKLAVVMDNWKLIHHFDDAHLELYDLAADPGETRNLYKTRPPILDDLVLLLDQRLKEMAADTNEGDQAGLTEEDLLRLKSLGYI